ncbi:hypothetical protein VNO80_14318 [Phaseolus coccineus]|uniref:Uncharacterized protein n=1 Tax=Phaseolus coccineus TaxID=3886 RepID=A0AAN9MPB4_PHACN
MELAIVPVDSSFRDYQTLYEEWFNYADSDGDGRFTGHEAIKFFTMSNLSRQELKQVPSSSVTSIVDGLKRLYLQKLKPLEVAYRYNDFVSPLLSGPDERSIPGNTVAVQADMPFSGLTTFGTSFLSKFECSQMPHPLLEHITFVDSPGVLSGEKQRTHRQYDFTGVTSWFAAKCDLILLLFDPHKLDVSDEFKRVISSLRGHDDKIRVVLNKADQVDPQQLMRIYGALMWSLGKVLNVPEVMRVYIGSFNDKFMHDSISGQLGDELFQKEQDDLLSDLKDIPKKACDRKINEFVKRARAVVIHAYIISHLKKQMPTMIGKAKAQQKLIDNLDVEFGKVQREFHLPAGDFPNVEQFRETLSGYNIDRFEKLNKKMIQTVDDMLAYDIPNLLKAFRNPYVSSFDLILYSPDSPYLGHRPRQLRQPPLVPLLSLSLSQVLSRMKLPTTNVDLGPKKIEHEKEEGRLLHCDFCDIEVVHNLAQMFMPGLACACVDNTTGDPFSTPGFVAVDMRKEMIEFVTQKSELFVAESIISEGGPDGEALEHPFDIISYFVDEFVNSKRNLWSQFSGWLLSDKREDKIDDFVQEMEVNGFWPLDRREALAKDLLKNVDFKSSFHCSMSFNSAEDLANHVDACDFRSVICQNEGCNIRVSAGQLKEHDSTCDFKIVPCEQKCTANIFRREMDRHCLTVCPLKLVNCPFSAIGCRSTTAQSMIRKHCSDDIESHLFLILKGIHQPASSEDLQRRVEQIVQTSSRSKLAEARDVRSFKRIVKDLEVKLGSLEVSAEEKTSTEEVAKNEDREENRTSAVNGVNKEDVNTENEKQG